MSYSDYALIKKSTLTDIGDAIRIKKGTSNLIDPANFSSEIENIVGKTIIEGHTEVASIITDGASYINTYICPNPEYSIEIECKLTKSVSSNWDFLFGTRHGQYSRWVARFENGENGQFKAQRSSASDGVTGEWYNSEYYKSDFIDKYKVFKLAKNIAYVDGVKKHTFAATTDSDVCHYDYPLFLFAVNETNNLSALTNNTAYIETKYVKLWDEKDNLVLDLIPVVKNDGTVCMYNKVNGAYYYNSGEGTFTYSELNMGALIDIDMSNGTNIGTGGSAYDAVNHNGTFVDGKFVLDAPGCLTVPTEFMAKSSNKPWTVALTIDDYTVSDEKYSRIARGSADVPSVYWSNQNPPNGFEHKLTCWSSLDTAISDRNCGTTWYDASFYNVSDNGRIQFADFTGMKTTFVFRNDGVNTELWINGSKRCIADSNSYDNSRWANTFAIGNSEYDKDNDYAVWNMSHLECSMLKLWDRAITNEEIAALSSITTPTPEEPEPAVTMEEAMYEYYGIDKNEYPYLFITTWYRDESTWRIKPVFAKSNGGDGSQLTDCLFINSASGVHYDRPITVDEYNNTTYYSDPTMIFNTLKDANVVIDFERESYTTDDETHKAWYYTNYDTTLHTYWSDLRTLYI